MTERKSPIIDPHIHLWDQRRTPRKGSPLVKALGWRPDVMMRVAYRVFPDDLIAFFGRPDHVLSDYLWADYEADTRGRALASFVHIQAGWEARGALGPVGETRWLEQLGMPRLGAIVGHADLGLGLGVEPVLEAHLEASPRFRGIRYMLANHPDAGVHSFCPVANQSWHPQWREGYALLARYGLSFDAWVYHHQLDDVRALARDVPDVPIALCHAGSPVGSAGRFSQTGQTPGERAEITRRWREGMQRLSEHDNVHVKLSGLTMPCLGRGYERGGPPTLEALVEQMGPAIDFLIETFGASRCMFASNFPVDKISLSWSQLYDVFERVVADRSEAERRALFHDTAAAFYGLGD